MESGLGGPGRREPPLQVILMAIALVAAAFAGAGIGLVWQGAGFGNEAKHDAAAEGTADQTDAEAQGEGAAEPESGSA